MLCCGAVYPWMKPKVWPLNWKLLSSNLLWYCFLCYTRWFKLLHLWMKPKVWPLNWSYWAVICCATVYYATQGGSNFCICGWNLKCGHWNESYRAFPSCGALYYAVQSGSTIESVDEILKFDHSNESFSGTEFANQVESLIQWLCHPMS